METKTNSQFADHLNLAQQEALKLMSRPWEMKRIFTWIDTRNEQFDAPLKLFSEILESLTSSGAGVYSLSSGLKDNSALIYAEGDDSRTEKESVVYTALSHVGTVPCVANIFLKVTLTLERTKDFPCSVDCQLFTESVSFGEKGNRQWSGTHLWSHDGDWSGLTFPLSFEDQQWKKFRETLEHESPQFKQFFKAPRQNPMQIIHAFAVLIGRCRR